MYDIEVRGSSRLEVEIGLAKFDSASVAVAIALGRVNTQCAGTRVSDTRQRPVVLEYEDIVPRLGDLPKRPVVFIALPSRHARSRCAIRTIEQAVLGEEVVKGRT